VVQSAAPESGFRRFWRTVKQLFHEVTGAIFGLLALAWLNSAFRAYSHDVAHWLIALAVAVAALFAFFSITQFRRARKLR
jgi:chromate transport protein ChrA